MYYPMFFVSLAVRLPVSTAAEEALQSQPDLFASLFHSVSPLSDPFQPLCWHIPHSITSRSPTHQPLSAFFAPFGVSIWAVFCFLFLVKHTQRCVAHLQHSVKHPPVGSDVQTKAKSLYGRQIVACCFLLKVLFSDDLCALGCPVTPAAVSSRGRWAAVWPLSMFPL